MMVRLLVFSLLTKIRPVPLACAGGAAATKTARTRIDTRMRTHFVALKGAYALLKRTGKASAGVRHERANPRRRSRSRLAARPRREDLRLHPRGRRGEPCSPARRIHRPARPQR